MNNYVWTVSSTAPQYTHIFRPETEAERKKSKARKWFDLVTLAGNYVDGYGGLGGITRLLHFEYKKLDKKVKRKMDNYLLHK